MGLVLTATLGFTVWIVMWSLGAKSFDAFMITILILVIGATAHIVSPFLPGNRER